jgi:hypothetical protein
MRAVRPLAASLAAAAATLVAACGSDAGDRAARAQPPVHVAVVAPTDLASTRATSITVRGTVAPASADVRVLGQSAEVVGGSFTAKVDLRPGSNVIDVSAAAPRHAPALTAVRVTREMPVTVPDLGGLSPDDARAKLAPLGLGMDEQDAGGLIEELLPGDPGVCEQRPGAGDAVRKGSTVTVYVAKRC